MDNQILNTKKAKLKNIIMKNKEMINKLQKKVSSTKRFLLVFLIFTIVSLLLLFYFNNTRNDVVYPRKKTVPLTEEKVHNVTLEECSPYNMINGLEGYTTAKVKTVNNIYNLSQQVTKTTTTQTRKTSENGWVTYLPENSRSETETVEFYIILFEDSNGYEGIFQCRVDDAPAYIMEWYLYLSGLTHKKPETKTIFGFTQQYDFSFWSITDKTGGNLHNELQNKYYINIGNTSYIEDVEIPGAKEKQERLDAEYETALQEATKKTNRLNKIINIFSLPFLVGVYGFIISLLIMVLQQKKLKRYNAQNVQYLHQKWLLEDEHPTEVL